MHDTIQQAQGPTHPDVTVQLSGEDGNAHYVIGRVRRALREAGHAEAAAEFASAALRSESYDDLLQLAMRTVDVH
ncbi:hypothetical protein [Streptomyces javensis]|uniref:Tetratricopeptide repeat protein n=1 Tax=Streptomyces javensis TaxID=114698 RepID=A0ABS0R7U9_9ACTN|nr:hypothetical protein [Streptomyces javensis]MBI0313029.1 hypothetical protein [Streptomyces javensis]